MENGLSSTDCIGDFVTDRIIQSIYNKGINPNIPRRFPMNPFISFMASTTGRIARAVAG
jgi:hypothetical protein